MIHGALFEQNLGKEILYHPVHGQGHSICVAAHQQVNDADAFPRKVLVPDPQKLALEATDRTTTEKSGRVVTSEYGNSRQLEVGNTGNDHIPASRVHELAPLERGSESANVSAVVQVMHLRWLVNN